MVARHQWHDARSGAAWGSGPDDVWAVGHGGTILHWNGVVWATVPSGITHWIGGVWGTGPDDVWAVGFSETTGTGSIVHWNGAVLDDRHRQREGLRFGVWAAAPADAWVVGAGARGGTVAHWDGTRWSPFRSAQPPRRTS